MMTITLQSLPGIRTSRSLASNGCVNAVRWSNPGGRLPFGCLLPLRAGNGRLHGRSNGWQNIASRAPVRRHLVDLCRWFWRLP